MTRARRGVVAAALALLAAAPLVGPARAPGAGLGERGTCGRFSALPLPVAVIWYVTPLGNLAPPAHVFPTDHVYLMLRRSDPNDPWSPAVEAPVLAPGPADVVTVSRTARPVAPGTDYGISLAACEGLAYRFGHLRRLAPRLAAALGRARTACHDYVAGTVPAHLCEYSLRVPVRAGEQLGTAGGKDQNGLDFGATDERTKPLRYADERRYRRDGSHLLHVVCPLDYFDPPLRAGLEALLGDGNVHRTARPLCGQIAQDVPGRAQGVWFPPGKSVTSEGDALALVRDNVDPGVPVFSVGTSIPGLTSGAYRFEPRSHGRVDRDFRDVRPDGAPYCYEALSERQAGTFPGTVILQLRTPSRLRVEARGAPECGPGPWSFSAAAAELER